MINRIKFFLYSAVVIFAVYTVSNGYHYFFDATSPHVTLTGIDHEWYYAGEVSCLASGSDGYKVAKLSAWLDDKPFIDNFSLHGRSFEHRFSFPTKPLSNGKHSLKIEVVNGTYAARKTTIEKSFFVDNEPLQAAFSRPETDFKVLQGRTLHVKFQVNKKIKEAQVSTLNTTYVCFPESQHSSVYECFIPISCEEESDTHALPTNTKNKREQQ